MDRVVAFCLAAIVGLIAVAIWLVAAETEARAAAERAAAITGSDPARGRTLFSDRGCGQCHTVPGVRRATGLVGPDLRRFGARVYVAGVLANNPGNLIRWLRDPPAVDPRTAMPNLQLDEREARDLAAFLYTLD
jgi:cytochrome c1